MKLKEELAIPLRSMQEIARRIAKVSKESKLEVMEEEYVAQFKIELMDAVIQWCRGAKFSDICKVGFFYSSTLYVKNTDSYSLRTNSRDPLSGHSVGYRSFCDR